MFKRMYTFTTLALSFLLLWSSLSSTGYAADSEHEQPDIEWSRLFGGNASVGQSVTPTSDGGYVAVGNIQKTYYTLDHKNGITNNKVYAIKVDNNGVTQWERDVTNNSVYRYDDTYAYDVIESSNGSIIITGYTTDYVGKPTNVIYVTKLDASGTILWDKAYPQYSSSYYHLYGQKIIETASGDFVITGYGASSSGYAPAYLLKINPDGEEIWYRTLWLDDNQYFNDIAASPDGGIIAVGAIDNFFDPSVNAAITVKFSENGETVWEKIKRNDGAQRPSAFAIHPARDGGYIITGQLFQSVNSTSYIQKINETGDVLWEKNFDPAAGNDLFTQIQSVDGGYALLGRNTTGNYPAITTKYQIVIVNEDGELNKTYAFGDSDLKSVGKGIATPDGGYLVIGTVKRGDSHLQLVKIAGTPGGPTDPELTRIQFSPHQLKLSVGQSVGSVVNAVYSDASVTDVTYSAVYASLDPSIATVNSFGQITGVHPGSTIVTATYGGLSTTASIEITTVGEPLGHFLLDSDEYSLSIGTELDITAFYTDELGSTSIVTRDTAFSSANPEIATIDEEGNITGVAQGITYITATYHGISYTANVWVVRPYAPPAAK
ncbi:Bacterial Ig-like domain (group 2) [compost metagenome]